MTRTDPEITHSSPIHFLSPVKIEKKNMPTTSLGEIRIPETKGATVSERIREPKKPKNPLPNQLFNSIL